MMDKNTTARYSEGNHVLILESAFVGQKTVRELLIEYLSGEYRRKVKVDTDGGQQYNTDETVVTSDKKEEEQQ